MSEHLLTLIFCTFAKYPNISLLEQGEGQIFENEF